MPNASPPPVSAVKAATPLIGIISLLLMLVVCWFIQPAIPTASIMLVLGAAIPMIGWEIFIEKAYLRPSSGLILSLKRPSAEILRVTIVKLVGLAVTLFGGYAFYRYAWWYSGTSHKFYFDLLRTLLPYFLALAPIYIFMTSRYMLEPKDALWHFGALVLLDKRHVSPGKVKEHILGWIIKLFFLALMIYLLPGIVSVVLRFELSSLVDNSGIQIPVAITFFVQILFVFDVCFGTIGYILTSRLLDSHVVSVNSQLSAWFATAICYPPLIIMGTGGPLDYRIGTHEWHYWFADQPLVLWLWAVSILSLVSIYAWATVIFGIRFSNLTNRGVITNGPYKYFKHPAYLSKNIFWWLLHVPFFSTLGSGQVVRNCLLLILVNAIYFLRAKTEEAHLMTDPAYAAYSRWISKNGLLERAVNGIKRTVTHGLSEGFRVHRRG